MGSARLSNAFGVMGQGLALFAGKKYEEEQARIDKEWEMSIEKMRVQRENAREDRAVARDDKRTETETERYLAGQETQRQATAATAAYRADTTEITKEHFNREDVRKREDSLNQVLAGIEKRRMDALEAVDKGFSEDPSAEIDKVNTRYNTESATAIQGTVISLVRNKAPGYEVNSEDDFRSLLLQNRMPVDMAVPASKHLWAALNPDTAGQEPPPPPGPTPMTDWRAGAPPVVPEPEVPLFPNDAQPPVTAPQPGTPPQNIAAGSQVDMASPGSSAARFGLNPNARFGSTVKDLFDTSVTPPAGENPYRQMGQYGQ